MEEKRIKVVLVENHPIVREGLRAALQPEAGIQILAEAEDGAAGIFVCEKHQPDVLIINAILPGSDTLQTIAAIKNKTNCKIIVSSITQDANTLYEIRKCGADGFIGKDASTIEYASAIYVVNAGGIYLSKAIADRVFQVSQATSDKRNAYSLTARELEILSLLSSGYCNKEVANKYGLSVRTVEAHRLNIRRKTQSNTLSDLVRISRSLGLANMLGNISNANMPNINDGRI